MILIIPEKFYLLSCHSQQDRVDIVLKYDQTYDMISVRKPKYFQDSWAFDFIFFVPCQENQIIHILQCVYNDTKIIISNLINGALAK